MFVDLRKEGLIAPKRIAEPDNSGQMKSTTQLHLICQLTSLPGKFIKWLAHKFPNFPFLKFRSQFYEQKIIVGFVAIIKLQPSAYMWFWDLGEQCGGGLIPVWGIIEWVSLPDGWFSTPWTFSRTGASTTCCLWCLIYILRQLHR